MRARIRPISLAIAMVALLAGAGVHPAAAQGSGSPEAAEADRLKTAADDAFRRGDHLKALLFLEQAYRADPRPAFLGNKAFILEKLGQYPEAVQAYQAYLATNPAPEKRAVAEVAVDRLQPEVLVNSEPSGARVFIDNSESPSGQTPLRARVLVGTRLFRLERAGYRPRQVSRLVEPGQQAVVEVTLSAIPSAPASVEARAAPAEDDGARRTWGWVAVGGGAAAVGAGAVLMALASSEADERDSATSLSDWQTHDDAAVTFQTGGLVALGVGAAAIGTGVWLLVTAPDDTGAVAATPGGFALRF
jgi:hypothetical protein